MGAYDFAGGLVVHINAGAAALGVLLVIGNRKGHGTEPMPPHALPWTLLGTGILWFGWFGFNAGSGLVADGSADRTLYLGEEDRFRIDATFTDFAGKSGVAKIFHTTSQTGQFWFFSPENIELLIKVIDGRDVNNAYWLFHGSASNVQYTVTVTDTVADVQKVYTNPLGNFGSDGDIEAFPQ